MTRRRMPSAFDLLLLWHGLFAGAYTVAYLTAEGAPALHEFSGYVALGLLALRFMVARLAGQRAPWALPVPRAAMWKNFARQLLTGRLGALLGRTPFAPLSGLLILGVMILVSLSGLAADWWKWEDLHEGMAEGSLLLVLVHIAIVSFAPLLRRLAAKRDDDARLAPVALMASGSERHGRSPASQA
ncbi:MAG: cytochrome b/b6 domain-containing protein [Pseudomonadota bacterium]